MQCVLPEGKENLASTSDSHATHQELEANDTRLEAKMEAGFVKVHARIDALEGLMEGQFAELRGLIKESHAKLFRHFVYVLVGFSILLWGTLLTLAFVSPASAFPGI